MKTALVLLSILGTACALSVSSLFKTYGYFHFCLFVLREYVIIECSFKQMKNLHRRGKLEDSEENGVIHLSIYFLSLTTLPLDLLHMKHECTIYCVHAGL